MVAESMTLTSTAVCKVLVVILHIEINFLYKKVQFCSQPKQTTKVQMDVT